MIEGKQHTMLDGEIDWEQQGMVSNQPALISEQKQKA